MKKNFFYNFLLTVSNLVFPLFTFPYLTRSFGSEGMGICNFIISYGQNFTIIAALGIPVYGMREIAKLGDDPEKRSKLFLELLSIHLLFTGFLLILYFGSVFLVKDLRDYKELAMLGGAMILFNVFSVEWLFSGLSNFKYITTRTLIIRGLSVVSIFILVRRHNDYFIYFIILAVTALLTGLLDLWSARTMISRHSPLTLKGILSHRKPVSMLGLYLVLTNVYSVLPTTLLGFLSTKSAVGYYYGANRIIRMIISAFTALTTVLLPNLNLAVEQKDEHKQLQVMDKSLNVVISFGIPISFFLYLLAGQFVILLAGKSFAPSIAVIEIMSPVILLVAFAQVFVFMVLSVNRKDIEMIWLSVMGMILSVAINALFIGKYAEKATAVSQLTAELAVTIAAFFVARKVLDFSFPVKRLFQNLVLVIPFAGITWAAIQFTRDNFVVIMISGICCGIYFLVYQLYILKNGLMKDLISPYLTPQLTTILKF